MVKRVQLFSIVLCIGVVGFFVTSFAGEIWKTFDSTEWNFHVQYPGSWYRLPIAKYDGLEILNFPPSERAEGVVLKPGGAMIMVFRAPSRVRAVDEWIKENTRFDVDVRQRTISNFTRNPSGCISITKVSSRSEIGPGKYTADTAYYCTATQGLYQVMLSNWKGDRNQRRLEATALRMVLSLRVQ